MATLLCVACSPTEPTNPTPPSGTGSGGSGGGVGGGGSSLPTMDNVSFSSNEIVFVYTGNSFEQDLKDAILNLPQGATVQIEGLPEIFNKGTYPLTVTISLTGYQTLTLNVTLIINPATYDFSGITFDDLVLEYTGEEQDIPAIQGTLPTGVEVNYTLDNADKIQEKGTYTVTAHFTSNDSNMVLPYESKSITVSVKSKYRLTIDGDGNGTVDETKQLFEGEYIVLPDPVHPDPELEFDCWFDYMYDAPYDIANAPITRDTRLYGTFRAKRYYINYVLNAQNYIVSGVTPNNDMNQAYYNYSATDSITLTSPTCDGLEFVGWYTGSDFETPVTTLSMNIKDSQSVYAKWNRIPYAIEYNLYGGENNAQNITSYYIDTNFTLLNPSLRAGYEFGGWYTDSSFQNSITTIQGTRFAPLNLYAKWNAIPYAITYELNGGVNHAQNPATYTIENGEFNLYSASKDGWQFGGWFYDAELTSKVTKIDSSALTPITVYAKWEEIPPIQLEYVADYRNPETDITVTKVITSMTEVTLPEIYDGKNVTSIDPQAFKECSQITKLTIPNSVTYMAGEVLYNLGQLEDLTIPFIGSEVKLPNQYYQYPLGYLFGNRTYEGATVIYQSYHQNSTTGLNSQSYRMPNSLRTVTVTGGQIVGGAFYGMTKLTTVNMPANLTHIGSHAFYNCQSLTNISIPSTVTSIGIGAFGTCKLLNNVTIPSGVTSLSDSMFANCTSLTNITFNSTIQTIGNGVFKNTGLREFTVQEGTTSIGSTAFSGCPSLNKVTLSSTLNSIGTSAFETCTKLYEVWNYSDLVLEKGSSSHGSVARYALAIYTSNTAPSYIYNENGLQFFNDGTNAYFLGADNQNATSITLPEKHNGLSYSIASYAFSGMTSLESVFIPNTVTGIGEYAFNECTALKTISLPSSMTEIAQYTFRKCSNLKTISIPNGITKIGQYAFTYCTGLESIDFGATVSEIGTFAFQSCQKLLEAHLPNSVTQIGQYAFEDCIALQKITVPFVGTSLANSANETFGIIFGWNITPNTTMTKQSTVGNFSTSSQYSTYYIPDSLREITVLGGEITTGAFSNMGNITKVNLPTNLTKINRYAFYECLKLESVNIPASVSEISDYAFRNCQNLALTSLPSGLETIGHYSFYQCVKFTLNLPSNLNTIGDYAFYGCTKITNLTIPDSVTSVGEYAYRYCSSLASVKLSANMESVAQYCFANCPLTEIEWGGITTISRNAFEYARFEQLILPDQIKSITQDAFASNGYLKKVVVSPSATFLYRPFTNCNKLEELSVPFVQRLSSSVDNAYLAMLFGGTSYSDNSTKVPASLKKLTITNTTSIASYAMSGCGMLEEIILPEGLITISERAFEYCNNILSITLPSTLTTIGSGAFNTYGGIIEVYNLSNIDITLSSDVTTVGYINKNAVVIHDSLDAPSVIKTINGAKFAEVGDSNYLLRAPVVDGEATLPTLDDNKTYSVHNFAFYKNTSLVKVNMPNCVTNIGQSAFYETGLTSLDLPNSIESIGNYAFSRTKIATLNLPNSLTQLGAGVFDTIETLTELTIGTGLQEIPTNTFYKSNIERLVIPDNVITIGANAFFENFNLKEIVFGENLETIKDSAFEKCLGLTELVFNQKLKTLEPEVFYDCTGLRTVKLSQSLSSVGYSAFSNCRYVFEVWDPASFTDNNTVGGLTYYAKVIHKNLDDPQQIFADQNGFITYETESTVELLAYLGTNGTITLPITNANKPHVVGSSALYDNDVVTSVTIPEGYVEVGSSAFSQCANLTKVTMPSTMKKLGNSSFAWCSKLTNLKIGDNVTHIEYYAFSNSGNINKTTYGGCKYIASTTNPYFYLATTSSTKSSVSSSSISIHQDTRFIGDSAFSGCTSSSFTSITIPSSVMVINNNAFYDCKYLKTVTITDTTSSPSVLREIKGSAFSDCIRLTTITLPNSLELLEEHAFSGTTALTKINIPTSLTMIQAHVFESSGLTSVTGKTSGWYACQGDSYDNPTTKVSKTINYSTLKQNYFWIYG